MFRNIKISAKITGLILVISLIALTSVSVFTFKVNRGALRDKYLNSLNTIADQRAQYLNHYFGNIANSVKFLQTSSQFKNLLDSVATSDSLLTTLSQIKDLYSFDQLYITDARGSVLISTDSNLGRGGTFVDLDGNFLSRSAADIHFSTTRKNDKKEKDYFIFAGAPIHDKIMIVKVELNTLFKKLDENIDLGATGEIVVAQKDAISGSFFLINPLRNAPQAFLTKLESDKEAAASMEMALEGKDGSGPGLDYRKKEVIKAWRKINYASMVLIVKIDAEEVDGQGNGLIKIYVLCGITVLSIAVFLSMFFARSLTAPVNTMRNTLDMVAKGILPEKTETPTNDEFGLMANKVDVLVDTLKNNVEFAQKVGEGKFDAAFKPASENDALGLALLNMRDNLIENERRDNERNWIVRGVAEVGEILRMHDTLEALGDDVVKFIIQKIGAIQGAFYIVNDDDPNKKLIEMRASYAFNRKKYLKKTFRFAEGLVGQAAIEKDTVLRTEIPDEYITLTSGILGDQKPTCILIVPLITNEEVYGVVELAGLKKFNPSQVKFVQELSLILARTIFNIKVNERTRRLLAESQEMSNELKEKQEVLRQNAEEMQATQEELQRSNVKLEEQVEEVNRTQKRMQLLLENASEVITIYEEDGTVRYVSPSVESILGYGQKELQGKSDLDKVHPNSLEVANELFKHLREKPDEKITVQLEYKTKDGNYIWLEATGTNFMSNPAIHGFILNSRDITERRRAEQEQRMRSKMQALSENSPDLIARLENESISYINPVIETYTGKEPSSFLNKKVKEAELDERILEQWLKIVEQVNESNETISTEMDFPSQAGDRVMQVNAIPEFDDKNALESVLIVSHDISERKAIELEIQNKNKKINDSINYAKRIQNAILPNTKLINKTLPDSFILYKPRDVVSGDFPWFVQIKNDIFIAAVDCTGHGVPGALLSLIGYFLLNDIVRSRKITEPGKILDLLDEGVTQTLRQDQDDSATKDGMDIALCRINIESRTVEYAGAHRPLYFVKGGAMDEVKGNKFPIGGGIFKNQTNFTTTRIELSKGDSIYFSSDGFPDQFGGPEVRKFGPKKTREIIEKCHKKTMNEALVMFDTEWEAWKGDHKQTDDVLLIGIKF